MSRHISCAASIMLIVWFSPAGAVAQPEPVSADNPLIRAFIEQQQATNSYTAGLRQTLQLRGLREPVVSTGHIYFHSPDQLAMIFDQPAGEYLIVSDGMVYLKKSRKPLRQQPLANNRRPGSQDILFLLDLFAHGATNTLEFFEADLVETNAAIRVTLTPRQPQPGSRAPLRIVNWIGTADHELRQVQVEFENQNSITYDFLEPRRNLSLDPAVFDPPDARR